MTDERRIAARRRVLKGAKAIYGGYTFMVDCTVRDVSESGARLRVMGSVTLPESFSLYSPETQTMRPVRVTWRKANEVGISFEGEAREIRDSADPRERRLLGMSLA